MEVKKQKLFKVISAILILVIMVFCTSMNSYAEEVKDGISVTVSSDKENYSSEDEVKLKVTVKNTNDFEVSDIKIENILPDGISLVSGDISKDNINLKANEECTVDLSVKKTSTGQAEVTENKSNVVNTTTKDNTVSNSENIPKTGESRTTFIALIVMLIAVAVMIICLWKGRKNHLKFLSLFLCLGIVSTFGITDLTYALSNKTQAETINSSEEDISNFTTKFIYAIDNVNYTHNVKITYHDIDLYIFNTVDKKIYETVVSDNFKNASLGERKEIALNLLNKLESENMILKGSIIFSEENNIYFYEYINGGEGSVMLDDFSSSETNNNNFNISDEVDLLNLDSIYNFENVVKSISSKNVNEAYIASGNSNANRYIKDNLSVCNLTYYPKTALIIDCINENYERYINNNLVQTWTSNDLKTDLKSNVTVEEFKTILNGYNFINIDTHGNIDSKGNPIVFLQEEKKSFLDDKYYQDRKENRVGTTYGVFGGEYYLKSDFFSYYYSDKLIDKIIWLSCCKGYANDTLVKALANDCKAKSVIGYTDTVNAYYEAFIRDYVIHKLLFGHTIDEALKEAKSVYGNNDAQWYLKQYNKKDNTPAECKNYNGGNEKLVNLVLINTNGTLSGKVTDENNNPIQNAKIGIHNIRGISYGITATTNENGEYTLECPQDNYKIGVKADGYETFETDNFIDVIYGKETIFNITLKKEIEHTEITTEPPVTTTETTVTTMQTTTVTTETTTTTTTIPTYDGNIIDSGNCGADRDNVKWELYENGTLRIYGKGDMKTYAFKTSPFIDDDRINNIIIEKGVTSISSSVFSECTNLKSVIIPDSVTSIGLCAFEKCTNLTSITIPDSVKSIERETFLNCTSLESVIIPDSVTEIRDFAFSSCTSLTSITIPDSVTSIRDDAFYNCTSLTSIIIPNSVTYMGWSVFSHCTSLESIIISDSVTRINKLLFYECTNLTSITIPNSVEFIDTWVFYSCKNLSSITIPDSVTSIDDRAFSECTSLTDIYYKGTEEQWKQIKIGYFNDSLTNATIHYNSIS